MKFQNRKGKWLEVDDGVLTENYTVSIKKEQPSYLDLSDADGLSARIQKSIIESNQLKVTDHEVQLPESIYNHYFLPIRKQREKEATDKLKENFGFIMGNQERIMNHGPYFLIRSDFLTSGTSMAGSINFCLGSLLESWKESEELILETDSSRIYIISVQGSTLSGHFNITGWSPEKGVIEFENPGQKRLIDIIQHLNTWGANYRYRLRANFQQIEKLLDDLQ